MHMCVRAYIEHVCVCELAMELWTCVSDTYMHVHAIMHALDMCQCVSTVHKCML